MSSGLDVGLIMFPLTEFGGYAEEPAYAFANPLAIEFGFWGFLMACVIFPGEAWSWYGDKFATIYGTPTTMSALSFNILMAFAGGIIGP